MKLKIATQIFNEEYFIGDFLNFYLKLGVDEIHIFDGKSTDHTIKNINNFKKIHNNINEKIIIVDSNEKSRHLGNQTIVCNLILKKKNF